MRDKPQVLTVRELHLRPQKTAALVATEELILHNRIGIFGDCHANALSPRQVLIVFDDAYGQLEIPEGTLKENILLSGIDSQDLQSGDTLSLDDGRAELRITFPWEPCGRLNKVRPNLCRDSQGQRGYLARVVSSGRLCVNDHLQLTKAVYPSFSDDWRERVLSVARRVPTNSYLSYTRLALLAGVAHSYCRAFPRLLHSHLSADRVQRILPSTLSSLLLEWDGEAVFEPELLSQKHAVHI